MSRDYNQVKHSQLRNAARWLFTVLCTILYAVTVLNSQPNSSIEQSVAIAKKLARPLDADGFPASEQWSLAPVYKFDADWQGKNPDPQRATTVQLLFTADTLFVRFAAQYRTITVFSDSDKDGRRYQLWDRDVAEVFLQPDSSDPWRYKEFEVSPNGFWVDLDISHGQNQNLYSGLQRRVSTNEKTKTWFAELALPMKSIATDFN